MTVALVSATIKKYEFYRYTQKNCRDSGKRSYLKWVGPDQVKNVLIIRSRSVDANNGNENKMLSESILSIQVGPDLI